MFTKDNFVDVTDLTNIKKYIPYEYKDAKDFKYLYDNGSGHLYDCYTFKNKDDNILYMRLHDYRNNPNKLELEILYSDRSMEKVYDFLNRNIKDINYFYELEKGNKDVLVNGTGDCYRINLNGEEYGVKVQGHKAGQGKDISWIDVYKEEGDTVSIIRLDEERKNFVKKYKLDDVILDLYDRYKDSKKIEERNIVYYIANIMDSGRDEADRILDDYEKRTGDGSFTDRETGEKIVPLNLKEVNEYKPEQEISCIKGRNIEVKELENDYGYRLVKYVTKYKEKEKYYLVEVNNEKNKKTVYEFGENFNKASCGHFLSELNDYLKKNNMGIKDLKPNKKNNNTEIKKKKGGR